VVKQVALVVREDRSRVRCRCFAAEHRQPCHPPGHNAEKRNAVGQAIGRGETQFLDPAAGLQSSEKVSIFQRRAYHLSLCTASAWFATGRFVINFQKTGALPSVSRASPLELEETIHRRGCVTMLLNKAHRDDGN